MAEKVEYDPGQLRASMILFGERPMISYKVLSTRAGREGVHSQGDEGGGGDWPSRDYGISSNALWLGA